MRLELDIGNSFIKWRLLDEMGVIVDRDLIETGSEVLAYFSGSQFFNQVNELLISSVSSPDVEDEICRLFESRAVALRVFKAKAKKSICGVEFIYKDVSRLGVDRCLAMVAAYEKCQGGVMVIDCGSALTADLVLPNGKHAGGYIFPGFNLLKQSLLSGTSNVVVKKDVRPGVNLGASTEECVDNGVQMMMRSTLFGLIQLAESFKVYDVLLTGGDGLAAKALLDEKYEYDKDLVFKGLGMAGSCSINI